MRGHLFGDTIIFMKKHMDNEIIVIESIFKMWISYVNYNWTVYDRLYNIYFEIIVHKAQSV